MIVHENTSHKSELKIIDVRLDAGIEDTTFACPLRSAVLQGLSQPTGKKSLPSLLLYDQRGLRLFDTVTTDSEEYYLFSAEEEILREKGAEIIKAMHGGKGPVDEEVVLELGAGALRKTSYILRNLANFVEDQCTHLPSPPPITYYALDLERCELLRTLTQITKVPCNDRPCGDDYGVLGGVLAGKVEARGMWGTYDDGIRFINEGGLEKLRVNHRNVTTSDGGFKSIAKSRSDSRSPTRSIDSSNVPPLHFLFLGSTIGAFSRDDMSVFLSSLPLRAGSGDTLLLGLDGWNGRDVVIKTYNDRKGLAKSFVMNGLIGAGKALGDESLFPGSDWRYFSTCNEEKRRHEIYYQTMGPQTLNIPVVQGEDAEVDVHFTDGEMVHVAFNHKFSQEDVHTLFHDSNLRIIQKWTDSRGFYNLFLLDRPAVHFTVRN